MDFNVIRITMSSYIALVNESCAPFKCFHAVCTTANSLPEPQDPSEWGAVVGGLPLKVSLGRSTTTGSISDEPSVDNRASIGAHL